jgi:hypothetical protein
MAAPSTPGAAAPETALQKLARRPFTAQSLPSTSSNPVHSRHLKRIHIAPEILKAVKVCAGDALVLRKQPTPAGTESIEQGMQKMELQDVKSTISPISLRATVDR